MPLILHKSSKEEFLRLLRDTSEQDLQEAQDGLGNSLLHCVALLLFSHDGKGECFKLLIEKGLSIGTANAVGETRLCAHRGGSRFVIKREMLY